MKRAEKRAKWEAFSAHAPYGVINGQRLHACAELPYGLGTLGHCGCEVIAVYNALCLTHKPADLQQIARYMVRFAMLFGKWGTFPFAVGHSLKHFGLCIRKIRKENDLRRVLETGHRCVYVYWTKRPFRSSIHTVCMEQHDGALTIYNEYSNVGRQLVEQPDEFFGRRRTIAAYEILS